ncbi:MAG: tRNA pseudouridine(55) synthase TruB [Bacteriovoracia bacterium]
MSLSLRSGVLLVDKPAGMSSADVTNQIKRKHKFARIGHGGTLDPFATGLLVVLLGEATKVARFLLEGEKEYEAEAQIGSETATGDPEGEVIATAEVPSLDQAAWQTLTEPFLGRITQTPPIYSAIKVKGKPLYEYARKGEAVEAKPREVFVREIEIQEAEKNRLRFRVQCGGGTYIRVLAVDLARAAGTCAHLISLRRIGSSSFRVSDALSLQQVLDTATDELKLQGITQAVSHLPKIVCDSGAAQRIRQGNLAAFDFLKNQLEKPGYFLVATREGETEVPVAIANHNPMLIPFCSIERVFDPLHWRT